MRLTAATSDAEGFGVTVEFDSAAITVQKAELLLPRLTLLRSAASMAIDQCRDLIAIAAPEIARKKYQEARQGTKENA